MANLTNRKRHSLPDGSGAVPLCFVVKRRPSLGKALRLGAGQQLDEPLAGDGAAQGFGQAPVCLLYTSDAADD